MAKESISALLKGTAVVIDDEIKQPQSQIKQIIAELEKEGLLFVELTDIKDDITAFSNISFIILDWKLENSTLALPHTTGSELAKFYRQRVIDFIKSIADNYYVPILIFSSENVELIRNELMNNQNLEYALKSGRISVYNKSDLLSKNVIKQLNKWLKLNQSAHLFKHLESLINKAEHKFFNEFDLCNPKWPNFVYNMIAKDSPADINGEFQEFLLTSFSSRIQVEEFKTKYLKKCSLKRDEILKIYSSIKYVAYDSNLPDGAYCGDIYFGTDNDSKEETYYINITAPCDIRKNQFLLLKGTACATKKFDKIDKISEHTVFQINNQDSIIFSFNKFSRHKAKSINEISINNASFRRIGRLLHPYVTNLQDRFSRFLIRRGQPLNPKY